MFESLNVGLMASDGITSAMRSVASAADVAGDAASESSVEFGAFGQALESVDGDAIETAVSAKAASSAIDEVGDESIEAAAELQTLDASMGSTAASSTALAGSLGPLRGSLRTIGPLAAGIVPPLIGLGGALGGVATAAGGAAAGMGAMFAGGLQRKAENMAAANSDIADSGEAMQQIFGQLKSSISDAMEPLQTAANTEFAMAGLEGLVDLVGIAAQGFADMQDTLRPLAAMWGSAVLETAPQVFTEIDKTVQALEGTLQGFAGVIRDIPAAIAWFREQATVLDEDLGSFGGSAIAATAAIGEFGTTILDLVLPILSVTLDVLTWAMQLINAVPKPVLAAAAAFTIAAGAMALYGGVTGIAAAATGALTAALGVLTAPISAVGVAIAAVVGAVIGAITYFGLWSDIIGVVTAGWNALVEAVEFVIEVVYAVISAIGQLLGKWALFMGPLGIVIFTISHLGEIINWVGEMFRWFSGLVADVIDSVLGWVDTAVSAIQDLMEWAMNVVNAIPGVNIDFGDIQESIELDALKTDSAGEEGGESSDQPTEEKSQKEKSNHYDFRGADFGGASSSEIERTVKEAVREANRESRSREDASTF
jgi:hypothetical protein